MDKSLDTSSTQSALGRAFKRPEAISKFSPKQLKIAASLGAALIVVSSVYSFAPDFKNEIPSNVALVSPKAPEVPQDTPMELASVKLDEKGNPVEAASPMASASSSQVITEAPPTDRELLKQALATLERVESKMDSIMISYAANNQKMVDLDKKLSKASGAVAQPRKERSDFSSLSIYDVSPSGVVVGDGSKKLVVHPGQKLPGGATFIGFDPTSRTMKTDVGDFMIPS